MAISAPSKIHYLDNLKIFLTALVIVHHALVTYGGAGSWYYLETSSDMLSLILMTVVVATNQSFFMGFFFFMSALFTETSYEKKGRSRFLKDRLIRFGIPLLFYTVALGPVMNYLVARYGHNEDYSFGHYLSYYDDWIDFGVLWFVVALLFFTIIFAFTKNSRSATKISLPSNSTVVIFAVLLGLVSFIVRIFFPVGWTLKPLGWQLGHFPQYIAMFYIGIVATRNNWLRLLTWQQGKRLLLLPVLMVVIGFPVIYWLKTVTGSDISTFRGGLGWQSLFYSIWEMVSGISIIVVLLALAKEKWNSTSNFLQGLSRSAFAVYIIHPLFLIGVSLVLKDVEISKVYKLLICIVVAVPTTFLAGRLLVMMPLVKKVV